MQLQLWAYVIGEDLARSDTSMSLICGAKRKFRDGTVQLLEVLGADTPADIMTKYVDRAILERMLGIMGLSTLDGRAECAPLAAG